MGPHDDERKDDDMTYLDDDDIIIAFRSQWDGAILSIHSGYDTVADACADANRRNDESTMLLGHEGHWVAMQAWELDYC